MTVSDFSISRKAMIDSQLRTSGVSEPWVIAAMGETPREEFVPAAARDIAYMDRRVPLTVARALNPPLATGLMLQEAGVTADDLVLLIGAGCGYLAALLSGRAKHIVAVEEDAALAKMAKANLAGLTNVEIAQVALNEGAANGTRYSLIIIDGAVEQLPDAITGQLRDGGRVVAGLSDGAVSRVAIGYKRGNSAVLRPFADCSISPLPGFERISEFVF